MQSTVTHTHTSLSGVSGQRQVVNSGTSGFEPRCLEYAVVEFCMKNKADFDLCTTGSIKIYCKLEKNIKKTIIGTLHSLYISCRFIIKFWSFYNKICAVFYCLGEIPRTARLMRKIKMWFGQVLNKTKI